MIARAPRSERDAAMLGRGARFLTDEFVTQAVIPRVPGLAKAMPGWSIEIARVTPTRLTLRFTFDNGVTVYGKAYRCDMAPTKYRSVLPVRAFETIRRLWDNGFGPAGHYHVPEPIAFLEEETMILMGPAAGAPIQRLLARQPLDEAIESARAAARWLIALHTSDFEPLAFEPLTELPCERIKVLKELDTMAKAAAAFPSESRVLLGFLKQVRRLAPPSKLPLTLTPVHSQYSLGTVYLEGAHVTAIDLDNVAVSDPATDVARFVSKVKWSALFGKINNPAAAEPLAGAFLDEYQKAGVFSLPTLPYYTALYCLKEYAKIILKSDPGSPDRERAEEFCSSEIRLCSQGTSRRRIVSRDEAAGRLVEVTKPEFFAQSIFPLAGRSAVPGECNVSTVRNKRNGRLTLRYDVAPESVLYAKLQGDVRSRRLEVLQALWDDGFNSRSQYRVPRVLATFPDYNLLVMAAAPGVALSDMLGSAADREITAGTRQAARWLAALHASDVRIGSPEGDWDSLRFFRLSERFIQCCAAFPRQLNSLLDLLYWLRHELDKLPEVQQVVQTHGSYNPSHIFIAPGAATAIDLDRSRPSDPAKDVAEFISALCSQAFGLGWDGDRLDRLTGVFLEEYLDHAPAWPPGLPYYVSAYMLLHLCGALRTSDPGGSAAAGLMQYFQRQLEQTLAKSHRKLV